MIMILIMIINFTTCFYVLLNYGFNRKDFPGRSRIFKETYSLMLGNFSDLL